MVEGGGRVLTEFLTAGLADELQLVIAPFFVGDADRAPVRPRWTVPVDVPLTGPRWRRWSHRERGAAQVPAQRRPRWTGTGSTARSSCPTAVPPSTTAFSVGAVIVDAAGEEIAWGYSRETDDHVHAEESALAKLAADDPRLADRDDLQLDGTVQRAEVPAARRAAG